MLFVKVEGRAKHSCRIINPLTHHEYPGVQVERLVEGLPDSLGIGKKSLAVLRFRGKIGFLHFGFNL
jgi:hypothetical protein